MATEQALLEKKKKITFEAVASQPASQPASQARHREEQSRRINQTSILRRQIRKLDLILQLAKGPACATEESQKTNNDTERPFTPELGAAGRTRELACWTELEGCQAITTDDALLKSA
jgi:hypothetical protein